MSNKTTPLMPGGTVEAERSSRRWASGYSVLIAVGVAVVISAGGWFYYRHLYAEARRSVQDSLTAIADLKAEDIQNWMRERRGDAEVARDSVVIKRTVAQPDSDDVRQDAIERTQIFRQVYGYAAVIVADSTGKILLTDPREASAPEATVAEQIQLALHSKTVQVSDLGRGRPDEPSFLWMACPVFEHAKADGPTAGAVLLLVDPHTFLYPTVQRWPTPSKTAETLLVLRQAGKVTFLNQARYTDAVAAARFPKDSRGVTVASLAAQGKEGIFEATDDRGIPVFAALRNIRGTPWFLLAKVDEEEILAPLRQQAWDIGIITGLLLVATALGAGLFWRQQKLVYVRRELVERERAAEALQASESRFRILIEKATDIITVVNAGGIVRFASPSIETCLGYRPEELLNRCAYDLIHPDDVQGVASALQAMFSNPTITVSTEYRFRHRDGSWRIMQSLGRNIPGQATDGFIVFNSRDITESRQLELQFRQSQKMEAIGHLAGGVAHDFNNILSATMMQAEMMQMTHDLPAQAREGLTQILNYSKRAANLTRQLLMFSRQQVMQPRDLNVNDLVANLAKMLHRIIGENFSLRLNLRANALPVWGDPSMLEQVVLNLVVNARDAMPGGGEVTIETREQIFTPEDVATIPDATPGRYISMRVTDTGCGISPEHMQHIFEPFYTTKAAGKGTGLGLATVFGIVKQHRGIITVESEVGRGTTFSIFVPVVELKIKSQSDAAKRPDLPRGRETILLVEDESPVRELTKTVLERAGYRVLEAASGVQAESLWKQRREPIHLLLTDMVMPEGLNGWELAERLQKYEPSLKVIFASGHSAEQAARKLVLENGRSFLQKPFSSNQLLESVRQCLDRAIDPVPVSHSL